MWLEGDNISPMCYIRLPNSTPSVGAHLATQLHLTFRSPSSTLLRSSHNLPALPFKKVEEANGSFNYRNLNVIDQATTPPPRTSHCLRKASWRTLGGDGGVHGYCQEVRIVHHMIPSACQRHKIHAGLAPRGLILFLIMGKCLARCFPIVRIISEARSRAS